MAGEIHARVSRAVCGPRKARATPISSHTRELTLPGEPARHILRLGLGRPNSRAVGGSAYGCAVSTATFRLQSMPRAVGLAVMTAPGGSAQSMARYAVRYLGKTWTRPRRGLDALWGRAGTMGNYGGSRVYVLRAQ